MTININWLTTKPNTLHCHFEACWTIQDLQGFVQDYQYLTANQTVSFDMILTADIGLDTFPDIYVDFPVHHVQHTLIVVNAHKFYSQLSSIVNFVSPSCLTVFAGSWTEACHFVAA